MAGGGRVFWIVVPPLIVALWLGAVVVVFRRAPAGHLWMLGIFLASIAIGGFLLLYPHGIQGNGDYLGRFELSVAVSAGLGAVASLFLRQVGWARLVGIAIAGNIFVPGGLILLFVWSLAVGNTCLD